MTSRGSFIICALAALAWGCVFGLQRPPPRYSQQYMPQTSFSCRNKIVGSYYADPETDCQLFHVCVSVAGSIQDYRFLCPNDTAFDQESQTCADWYDVDCEAATLYYASDNFDLYRIGSGLESLHYDSIRSDYEPQDHLQRSESNDPIRSPYNANNYNNNANKDIDSPAKQKNNNYNARNQKQYNDPEIEKPQPVQQEEKKTNFRKISRKPVITTTTTTRQPTTAAPATTQSRYNPNQAFVYSTTTQRATSYNPPKITYQQAASSTQRPTTKYQSPVTTVRSTDAYTNYQTQSTTKSSFNNNIGFTGNYRLYETTAKPIPSTTKGAFNNNIGFNGNYRLYETTTKPNQHTEQENYSAQYTSSQPLPSTTKQPVYDYSQQQQQQQQQQVNNYNNYESTKQNTNTYNAYNNNNNNYYTSSAQKNNVTSSYPSTTVAPQYPNHNYDKVNNNNNNNNNNYKNYNYNNYQTKKVDNFNNQNSYTANTYAPTTYSPVTKKFPNHRGFFDKTTTTNNAAHQTTKSAQYTDTESTKLAKKPTQFKNYPSSFEATTRSYDFGRSSVGLGFSPSSVNHLAENVRSTTPTPRRAASPTTYNPNSFNVNTHASAAQSNTQPKQSYYQNNNQQQKQQYTTTAKYYESVVLGEQTTLRPNKISKKNDYDYAYYDNDPSTYDNIELEHVNSNKESVKIA